MEVLEVMFRKNFQKKSSVFFNQIPRWLTKDPKLLKSLHPLCCKVILWLGHVRRWGGPTANTSPLTTFQELSEELGARRRSINRAITSLAEAGVIRVERKRSRLRLTLMFVSPFDHKNETEQSDVEQSRKLDVSLNVIEGRSPSEVWSNGITDVPNGITNWSKGITDSAGVPSSWNVELSKDDQDALKQYTPL